MKRFQDSFSTRPAGHSVNRSPDPGFQEIYMGEKIPCEYSKIMPCEECKKSPSGYAREVELTDEDAERYLPRDGKNNIIVHKDCPLPPMSSVTRYGPDYYVLKAGRIIREDFERALPKYKQ